METTLNLDEDALEMALELAARERRSLGDVVSGLIRQGAQPREADLRERNGIPLFPLRRDAGTVTPAMVELLLEESE